MSCPELPNPTDSREVTIKTAWSRYTYRLFVLGDCVWCEYNGAYRGLLEQKLLPSITHKLSLLLYQ